jgi:AAA family ATP:ADP antiporter
VFYVWISIVTLLVFTQFGSWASQLLDPRQARRLFAFVLSGALVGGIGGGQVAALSSRWLGSRSTLLASAVLLAATLPLVARIRALAGIAGASRPLAARAGDVAPPVGSLTHIWRSRHLRSVAALMFVSIMVAQITDLQFNWVVEQSTERLDQRTMIFGNFFSSMALVAFVLQLAVTARLQRTIGVGASLRVLPMVMGIGSIALLGAAALVPAALIYVVATLKIGEGALRYSLDQGTRELLYVPVPEEIRSRVKALIDVLLQRVARAAAALLLLTVTFGLLTPVSVTWIVLALIVVWIGMTWSARRHYVASFREGLLARRIDPEERLDPSDAATLEELVAALGSAEEREVVQAIDLLVAQGRGRLVTPLLLHHDSAEVRRRTLEVLRTLERRDVRAGVERLIADEDPRVRAEAIRTFAELTGADAVGLLASKLRDGDPRVRGAAIVGVLQLAADEMPRRLARAALDDMTSDAAPAVRREAARALGGAPQEDLQNHMLRLLSDPDPDVVRAAVRGVAMWEERAGVNFVFVPILVSLLRERRLKHDVRQALVACGEEALPVLVHFLRDPGEYFWVRHALPTTISRFGGEAARDALLEALPCGESALDHGIIAGLASLRAHERGLRFPNDIVQEHVCEQARRYLRAFARLHAIARPGSLEVQGIRAVWRGPRRPRLLEQLLVDRMADHAKNLFGLLSLVHRHRELWLAFEQLRSDDLRTRNHAIEFLDNTVRPPVRRQVMAVIDDLPAEERLAEATALFHISTGGGEVEALRGIVQAAPGGDVAALWLGAAALAHIAEERVVELYDLARRSVSAGSDPLLVETGRWFEEQVFARETA